MTYAWTPALTNPETVTLSSSTVAQPTFTPTKTGQYRFSLVVTDGSSVASTADEVIVNVVKELPAHTTSFTYDGNGDRVKQTKGGVDTTYVVDSGPDNERVLMETTASATTYYVYGHDMLYSIDGAGPHYLHSDSLGSVAAVTDGSATVEQTYDYDVFGVMRAASGTSGNRYTFTGEENDASGLVYLRARYYDPSTGGFISRDPYPASGADTQTVNRYAYVKNNPTNSVDPSGETFVNPGVLERAATAAEILNGLAQMAVGVAGIVGGGSAFGGGAATCAVTFGGGCVVAVGGAAVATAGAGLVATGYVTTAAGLQKLLKGQPGSRAGQDPNYRSSASSKYFKSLQNWRGGIRTNGLIGKARRYFQWDPYHGEIEVYNWKGMPIGVQDTYGKWLNKSVETHYPLKI